MPKRTTWNKENKAVKASQVAFEMEQAIARQIHEMAAKDGLTPSSQIRKLLGLSYSPPKRPRLSVSLSSEDYEALGEKYGLAPDDTLAIKRQMMEELIQLFEK